MDEIANRRKQMRGRQRGRARERADGARCGRAGCPGPDAGVSFPEGHARWDLQDIILGRTTYLR